MPKLEELRIARDEAHDSFVKADDSFAKAGDAADMVVGALVDAGDARLKAIEAFEKSDNAYLTELNKED